MTDGSKSVISEALPPDWEITMLVCGKLGMQFDHALTVSGLAGASSQTIMFARSCWRCGLIETERAVLEQLKQLADGGAIGATAALAKLVDKRLHGENSPVPAGLGYFGVTDSAEILEHINEALDRQREFLSMHHEVNDDGSPVEDDTP